MIEHVKDSVIDYARTKMEIGNRRLSEMITRKIGDIIGPNDPKVRAIVEEDFTPILKKILG